MRKLLLIGIAVVLSVIVLAKTNNVSATPGISVTITVIDPDIVDLSDKATYTVNVESVTTEDENVRLTVSGDPTITFDWTTKEFVLTVGSTQSFSLEASATLSSTPGSYPFTVLGEAWPTWFDMDLDGDGDVDYDDAALMGLLETSDATNYVILPLTFVIPEYPLGTITVLGAFLGATGLYMARKRRPMKAPIQ